jgi:hypothetical protein
MVILGGQSAGMARSSPVMSARITLEGRKARGGQGRDGSQVAARERQRHVLDLLEGEDSPAGSELPVEAYQPFGEKPLGVYRAEPESSSRDGA